MSINILKIEFARVEDGTYTPVEMIPKDTPRPDVEIAQSSTTADTITVSGTVTDVVSKTTEDADGTLLTFAINGQDVDLTPSGDGSFSFTSSALPLGYGRNVVTCRATNCLGASGFDSVIVQVTDTGQTLADGPASDPNTAPQYVLQVGGLQGDSPYTADLGSIAFSGVEGRMATAVQK